MGGSGYARPPLPGEPSKTVKNADGKSIEVVVGEDGKPIVVPGVTTVLKAFGEPPALVQWKIDQTAAYAVANVDSLLNRTLEQGFGFLRFFHKRVPDLADPLRNAHSGVLNDLAELGTAIHEWTQTDVDQNGFYPPVDSEALQQMIEAWRSWRFSNIVKPFMTEVTVYGDGYAGTFDGLWYVNGKLSLLDEKSSKAIRDGHLMQLSALREAKTFYVKNESGEWEAHQVPEPEEFGFIQLRPDDMDNRGNFIPKFVKYHRVTTDELDIWYGRFRAALFVLDCDKRLKAFARD